MPTADAPPPVVPSSLDPAPDEIRRMGALAVELAASYYGALPGLPIAPDVSADQIRARLDATFPEEGRPFDELVGVVRDVVLPACRHNGHPRFFGYVASPGTAATALADLLASALNPNVTSWRSAPGPTEMERQVVDWIRRIVGCAADADGVLVSGGSMANLCGLAAARDAAAPSPVTRAGMQTGGPPMTVYVSEEAHYSVSKAAGLLGIGRDNVRPVPTDEGFRMDPGELEAAVGRDREAGLRPCCVVASAGTVASGAFDPLMDIADVAERHGLWLHVDGSYGGFAALAPSTRRLFAGIERADSVALDPHKWLYVPMDCGCVLYKDPAAARAVFGHDAEYTRVIGHEADEAYAFWDYSPELSRRFRGLKVWMMLAHVGTRALGEAVERNCACARYAAERIAQSDDLEMLAPVELSIFCFRYVPPAARAAYRAADADGRRALDHDLDALNERLLAWLQKDGSSYLSNARLRGRFALRGCVLSFRTTQRDIDVMLQDVRRAARAVGAA